MSAQERFVGVSQKIGPHQANWRIHKGGKEEMQVVAAKRNGYLKTTVEHEPNGDVTITDRYDNGTRISRFLPDESAEIQVEEVSHDGYKSPAVLRIGK